MRLSTSFSDISGGALSDVLGPLPPGSILKGIRASSSCLTIAATGISAGSPLLSATVMQGPAAFNDTALIRDGQPLFGRKGSANVIAGVPAEFVPYLAPQYFALDEPLPDGGYIGLEFLSSGDTTIDGAASLDVLFPEDDDRRGLPSTARVKSTSAPKTLKESKAPHPPVRTQVPLPVQSGGKPSPQPTAPFGR